MKESISYSFLLNIVIVFIFVCFAIIMGVLSYYRAFRANEAIIESIEKYEGFNCASQAEIDRKLGVIGYMTPFNVTCDGKDKPCKTDTNNNYAIISYNLDGPVSEKYLDDTKITDLASKQIDDDGKETKAPITGIYANNDEMNSLAANSRKYYDVSTKHYQYGVYTYMYVDLPVVAGMIRIPYYSKTSVMYEFRNLYASEDNISGEKIYDSRLTVEGSNGKRIRFDEMKKNIEQDYLKSSTGQGHIIKDINSDGYDARERAQYDPNGDGMIDMRDMTLAESSYSPFYATYGTCEKIKTFENY